MTKQKQKTDDKTKTTTIKLDLSVHAEVKRMAESQRRDFTGQMRVIVDEWLEQYKRIEEGKKAKQ